MIQNVIMRNLQNFNMVLEEQRNDPVISSQYSDSQHGTPSALPFYIYSTHYLFDLL